MIDRLYKTYCFWRNHGSKSLFRLLALKIKMGGASLSAAPHAATTRYDVVNQGNVRDSVKARFQACSPLRVFSSQVVGCDKRISVVTDSINSGSLYGGVGTAIILAVLLAQEINARIRIITRTERAQPANFHHLLETYGLSIAHEVEFVFAPHYDYRYEIDLLEGEQFITTSWWTTASTMSSVRHGSIIYLLQEDERMFYPYGDDHLRCSSVLRSNGIRFVINTQLLFDHLVGQGFTNVAENGMWFEPAFPDNLYFPRCSTKSIKRTLMFYARPNNLRNLFYFGINVIEEAVARGIIDLNSWDILFVGKDIPDVVIGESYTPMVRQNMAWKDYAELVGSVDVGISLMYTPHPSYPPLDLAASGAIAVTNRLSNKMDLGSYSKNIVVGDLDLESMLCALSEGLRLASNETLRNANYQSAGLSRDWYSTLSPVILNLAKS